MTADAEGMGSAARETDLLTSEHVGLRQHGVEPSVPYIPGHPSECVTQRD